MIHKISEVLNVAEDIAAKQRGASTVTGSIIDTTLYEGGFAYRASCGAVGGGGTLDAKLQESDDSGMAGATDVANGAFTQIVAAGSAIKDFRVRQLTKRYVRLSATSAVANVDYGFTFVGQKRVV